MKTPGQFQRSPCNNPFLQCLLLLLGGWVVAGCAGGSGMFENRITGKPVVQFTPVAITNQLSQDLLQPSKSAFTLGPGDRLEISILGNPASRAVALVGPDGKIYYSLLPGIDVWGLSLEQTRAVLEQGLAQYLSAPQVSVTLREVGSKYVWLLGRLNRPGVYPLPGPMTLLEAVAIAGGTARSGSEYSTEDLADLRHSFVMRRGQILPVDFYRLLRKGDTSQNVMLQPDDFVFVRSSLAQEVYVLGAVRFPRVVTFREGMTLVSAVSEANGAVRFDLTGPYQYSLPTDAYMSHVAIVRGSMSQPTIAVVDYGAVIKGHAQDVPLEPGDIVYVPNSPYRVLKSYANLIMNSFVTTVAANEGIRAGGGQVGVGVSVPVVPIH